MAFEPVQAQPSHDGQHDANHHAGLQGLAIHDEQRADAEEVRHGGGPPLTAPLLIEKAVRTITLRHTTARPSLCGRVQHGRYTWSITVDRRSRISAAIFFCPASRSASSLRCLLCKLTSCLLACCSHWRRSSWALRQHSRLRCLPGMQRQQISPQRESAIRFAAWMGSCPRVARLGACICPDAADVAVHALATFLSYCSVRNL